MIRTFLDIRLHTDAVGIHYFGGDDWRRPRFNDIVTFESLDDDSRQIRWR